MLTHAKAPAPPLVVPPVRSRLCESCRLHQARLMVSWRDAQFRVCLDCIPTSLHADALTSGENRSAALPRRPAPQITVVDIPSAREATCRLKETPMDDSKTRLAEIVDELDDLTLELANIGVADRDELGDKAVQVEQACKAVRSAKDQVEGLIPDDKPGED